MDLKRGLVISVQMESTKIFYLRQAKVVLRPLLTHLSPPVLLKSLFPQSAPSTVFTSDPSVTAVLAGLVRGVLSKTAPTNAVKRECARKGLATAILAGQAPTVRWRSAVTIALLKDTVSREPVCVFLNGRAHFVSFPLAKTRSAQETVFVTKANVSALRNGQEKAALYP